MHPWGWCVQQEAEAPGCSGSSSSSTAALAPPSYANMLVRRAREGASSGGGGSSGGGAAPPCSSDTLCCLAIPADMSVAEFCTFCGAYLERIREMRVLRREGGKRAVCMVLVRFDGADSATSFFDDTNNKPVRSGSCRSAALRMCTPSNHRSGQRAGLGVPVAGAIL